MEIKEIAQTLKLKMQDPDDGRFDIGEFAEALVAEIAKQNEPVYAFRRKGLDDFCTCDKRRFDELSQKPALFDVQVFYNSPPTSEQIANETAEACARYVNRFLNGDGIQDEAWIRDIESGIRSGAWKES